MVSLHIKHGFFAHELSLVSSTLIANRMDVINESVDVIARVHVSQAWIDFHDLSQNFRPYLKLSGVISHITGTLPLNINRVDFDENSDHYATGQIESIYEFSDDELVLLAKGGLWSHALTLPSHIVNNYYDIPLSCAVTIIPPAERADAPLVFLDTPIRTPVFSAEICGYSIAQAFFEVSSSGNSGFYVSQANVIPSHTAHSISSTPVPPKEVALIPSSPATQQEQTNRSEKPATAPVTPAPPAPSEDNTQSAANEVAASSAQPQASNSREARKNALLAARAGRSAARRRSMLSKGELDDKKVQSQARSPLP